MKAKESFARALGGVSGVVIGALAPHLGCLGVFMAGAAGAGFSAGTAQVIATGAGVTALVAAGGAAIYGLKPSNALCCVVFGETRGIRLKKAFAMAAAGFVVMGAVNTVLDRGIVNNARTAGYLEWAHANGRSTWQALNEICATVNP
jgi:hypothetical protein